MSRVRIKICGVTRPQDALAAADAGADAIGMIFYPPAPRNISLGRAREILSVLPPFVSPIGVFAEALTDEILDTAAQLGLRTVQLNGDQSPDEVAELEGVSVLKAIRVSPDSLRSQTELWRSALPRNLIGIVLEPGHSKERGGSGVANDWTTVIREIEAGSFKGLPPIIAAGGLKPETVGEVVRTLRPFAVDVSSGVEESLGIKSAEKIAAFVEEVRAAEQST